MSRYAMLSVSVPEIVSSKAEDDSKSNRMVPAVPELVSTVLSLDMLSLRGVVK